MTAKRCSNNKHFVVIADNKLCKHYFNNLTFYYFIFMFYHWQPTLRAYVHSVGLHSEQLLNENVAFLADSSHSSRSLSLC